MTFIGIISEYKNFENIKESLNENLKNEISLIYINKKNISNMKNIRFEILVIDSDISKYIEERKLIERLCSYARYLVINTDLNKVIENINNNKIITYGLNQEATVTISSVTESSTLICLQKNLKIKDKFIEIGEKLVKRDETSKLKIYEILIIFIINLIEKKP